MRGGMAAWAQLVVLEERAELVLLAVEVASEVAAERLAVATLELALVVVVEVALWVHPKIGRRTDRNAHRLPQLFYMMDKEFLAQELQPVEEELALEQEVAAPAPQRTVSAAVAQELEAQAVASEFASKDAAVAERCSPVVAEAEVGDLRASEHPEN